jgi:hypothetical protein
MAVSKGPRGRNVGNDPNIKPENDKAEGREGKTWTVAVDDFRDQKGVMTNHNGLPLNLLA